MAEITINDFGRGLVTVLPPHLLPKEVAPGAAVVADNWDLSESFGSLKKRKGQIEHIASIGAGKVTFLQEFIESDGTENFVAAADDDIYDITGASFVSIFNDANISGSEVNGTAMNDLLVLVNENITTQKWTGTGATAVLLGLPPANVKYAVTHRGRVFMLNTSAGKSRLHFSDLDDVETWVGGNSGFIDINPDDGDVGTGILPVKEVLVIFKRRSTHILTGGTDSSEFVVKKITDLAGCVANRTAVATEGFGLFLSDLGLFSISPDGIAFMSYNIRPTLLGLTDAQKTTAVAGRLRGQYWLAFDNDSDGDNETVLILDYVNGNWFRYTSTNNGMNINVFATKQDQTFFSGGSVLIKIRQHDSGDSDEGTAITATWRSGQFDFDVFSADKELLDFTLFAGAITGAAMTVRTFLDGLQNPSTFTVPLDALAVGETTVITGTHGSQREEGRLLQFEIENAEAATDPDIFAINFNVAVKTRTET